jgi:hypothetical protein
LWFDQCQTKFLSFLSEFSLSTIYNFRYFGDWIFGRDRP